MLGIDVDEIYAYTLYENIKEDFKSERIDRIEGIYEPNVYIIQEKETKLKYIGSRTARECLDKDIGSVYFTSSEYIRNDWKDNNDLYKILNVIKCASNHDALYLELFFISEYNAVYRDDYINHGHPYIGFSHSGKKFSERHKRNLSESTVRFKSNMSEEDKILLSKKMSDGGKRRFESQESRDKVRNGVLKYIEENNVTYEEVADRISYLHKIGHYDEAYKKMSIALKGKKKPDDFGEKISKALTGRIFTDEWKKNLSDSRKGKCKGDRNAMADPEKRKKVSDSKLGRRRVDLSGGGFIYCKSELLHMYYLHTNNKYYDYPEEIVG